MAELPSPEGAGWLAALTTGAVSVLFGAYKALRAVKTDSRVDRTDARLDRYVERLEARIKELEARADGFAQERNRALAAEAELKALVKSLQADITERDEEIARLTAEVAEIREEWDERCKGCTLRPPATLTG